jgi:hypothetical protein
MVGVLVGALFAAAPAVAEQGGGGTSNMIDDGNNPKPCDSDICLPTGDPDSPLPGPSGGETGGDGEGIPQEIPPSDVPSSPPPPPPPPFIPEGTDTDGWEYPDDPTPTNPLPTGGGGTSSGGPSGGGGSGGGGGGGGTPGNGGGTNGGGGGGGTQPQADCTESTPKGPTGGGKTGPAKPDAPTCKAGESCEKCGPKKAAACKTCADDDKKREDAIKFEYNNCIAAAKKEATTHCHLGEIPGGSVNTVIGAITGSNFPATSVILVGDHWSQAQACYAANGYTWVHGCKTAFEEEWCELVWPDFATECHKTQGWMKCINGWFGGNAAVFGQFDVNAGASWTVPIVGIEVKLDGNYVATVAWAPSEGMAALCAKKANKQLEIAEGKATTCKQNVNTKYVGGQLCAF